MNAIQAASRLFESPSRRFAVRLWDGTHLPPAQAEAPRGEVVLTRPEAVAVLAPPVSELTLAEAFLDGDLELEGDAIGLLEAAALWEGPRATLTLVPAVASALAQRVTRVPWMPGASRRAAGAFSIPVALWRHSIPRDRRAVRYHYDVSDDFYRLFLDADLVYSCAYFPTGEETLEEAQRAKLELVCRKLGLRPGERFLDVGCGWGSLVAHAAAQHGVEAVGITVSDNQLNEARRRLGSGAAAQRVEIRGADYRRLGPEERFDKVASVGMMEHVGRRRLDAYFSGIERHLVPGGLFLNHAIADTSRGESTVPWASRSGDSGFISRYIFPDGDLVPLRDVVAAAERAGFEVRDVESLREHYAETLARWLRRLEARLGDAERLVGVRRTRAYRLYLASSAAAFLVGRIGVYQILLAKRTREGRALGTPRARAAWYGPPGDPPPHANGAGAR